MRLSTVLLSSALLSTLTGCPSDDPVDEVGDETAETGGTGSEAGDPCAPASDAVDESACSALASDYLPNDSDNDMYAACISDGGTYELVSDPPGSIARVEAAEEIADLLWRNGAPTAEDFTMARTAYELDQGLGSRVDRREDLHYPEIPMAEWNPGLDPDKQCSDTTLAETYADRCAGPAKLRPLINEAFIAGMSGEGDPNIHAARIKAALYWFTYLSPYKECYTCIAKDADCDSCWAYYTGGAQVDGAGLFLAKFLSEHSPNTHQRIFDAILAVRCWRDLYPMAMYPTYDDLPPEGQELFDTAWEQLDNALHRGLAVVLRQHVLAQDDEQCSSATAANWEFVTIVGGALDREIRERDGAAADELMAIYASEAPTSDDLARVAELLDAVIDCP